MIFLQAGKIVETSYNTLFNYGAVGAILVLCLLTLYGIVRYAIKKNEEIQSRYVAELTLLRNQLNKYIEEDRTKLIDVVNRNSNIMETILRSNEKQIEVFEEVRDEIHSLRMQQAPK